MSNNLLLAIAMFICIGLNLLVVFTTSSLFLGGFALLAAGWCCICFMVNIEAWRRE